MMPIPLGRQTSFHDPHGSQEFGIFHQTPRSKPPTSSLESNSLGIPLHIQHHPGKTNPANPLSWRPDLEKGVKDNIQIQILSPLKSKESSSMKILPERVDTRIRAQGKKTSPHSAKPEESSSSEILPKRVDTRAMSLKQSETIESIVTKNQFYAEKFAVEGLKLKDSPWYKKDNLIHWKTLLYILPNPQLQEQIIQ